MKICIDSNRRNINQTFNANSSKISCIKKNIENSQHLLSNSPILSSTSTEWNANKNPTQQQQERLKNKQLILIKPLENPNEGCQQNVFQIDS
jgi:hypothetical protein